MGNILMAIAVGGAVGVLLSHAASNTPIANRLTIPETHISLVRKELLILRSSFFDW
jgi:hypothetical protein